MPHKARILLVEDDGGHLGLIRRAFQTRGPEMSLSIATTLAEARHCLARSTFDLLITDLVLPDGRGTQLLEDDQRRHDLPVVVMTSFGNEQAAVDAIKAGALDYIVKSTEMLTNIPRIAQRALENWENIVERKRAQDALREGEYRLAMAIECAGLGFWDQDFATGRVTRGDNWMEMLEYKPGEIELDVSAWRQLIHPDDRPHVDKCARDHEAGLTRIFSVEHRMRAKSGQWKWIRNWGRVVQRDENGRPIRAIGVHLDVSERKRAEEALRLSHRVLKIANRHAEKGPLLDELVAEIQSVTGCDSVGIRILDESGNIPYQAYTGFPERFYRLESPLSINSDECMCSRVVKGETDAKLPCFTPGGSFFINGSTRFLAKTSEDEKGTTRNTCNRFGYESVALIPMRLKNRVLGLIHIADHGENKVPLQMVELLENTASQLGSAVQRVLAEEALQEQHNRLTTIFAAIPDPLLLKDRDFLYRTVNPATCDLLGKSEAEIIGKTDFDLFRREEAEVHRNGDLQVIANGQTLVHDETLTGADGTRFMNVAKTPVFDRAGNVSGILVSLRDLTQRRQTQLELADSKRAAEAANRAKTDFLANMSHEIRTPMTAILGFADLLMSPNLSQREQRRHLQTIRHNGQVLLELINDILDLSKIEAGRMVIEPIDCSAWDVVEDVAALMRIRAEEKGLELQVEYEFPLPQTVRTDPVRLRQILTNLVSNAIKFTDQGSVRIAVRCTAPQGTASQETAPRMAFAVADTGIGMKPEEMTRLFQPFTQIDASSARRFGGTGLGLSISKHLAEKLGGDIQVRTQLGAGSTFTLRIDPGPLQGVTTLNEPPTRKVQPRDAAEGPQFSGRVLLAEDGRDIQELIGFVLGGTGLEVELAENGCIARRKALASVADGRPYGLILMDIQMPEVDGYEATRQLRRDGWYGPIIALTAHAMAGDCERCLQAGCDDYLTKPIDRGKLLSTVGRHLGQPIAAESNTPRLSPCEGPLISSKADHPVLRNLLRDFVEELPGRADKIENALQTGDLDSVGDLTHQLKGAAAIYGFEPIADSSCRINERAARGDDPQKILAAVTELGTLCRRATSTREGDCPEQEQKTVKE